MINVSVLKFLLVKA